MIGAGGGYSLQETAQALGASIDGVFNVDFPQISMKEDGAPGLKSFVEAYQKRYGTQPRSGHSLVNYVGAKAFLEVMVDAKSLDKDKIRAAALAYKKPVGSSAAGWGFQFGENGQNQLASSNLMQWQGGKLLTVFPESVATAKPIVAK